MWLFLRRISRLGLERESGQRGRGEPRGRIVLESSLLIFDSYSSLALFLGGRYLPLSHPWFGMTHTHCIAFSGSVSRLCLYSTSFAPRPRRICSDTCKRYPSSDHVFQLSDFAFHTMANGFGGGYSDFYVLRDTHLVEDIVSPYFFHHAFAAWEWFLVQSSDPAVYFIFASICIACVGLHFIGPRGSVQSGVFVSPCFS